MNIAIINEETLSKLFYGNKLKFYGFGRNGFVIKTYKIAESIEEGNWISVDGDHNIIKSMHYLKKDGCKIECRNIEDMDLDTAPIEAERLMKWIKNAKMFVGGIIDVDRTESGGCDIGTSKVVRP